MTRFRGSCRCRRCGVEGGDGYGSSELLNRRRWINSRRRAESSVGEDLYRYLGCYSEVRSQTRYVFVEPAIPSTPAVHPDHLRSTDICLQWPGKV